MVVPYAGAWIETYWSSDAGQWCRVVPYAGAWIETS